MKIANGRFPSQVNAEREKAIESAFRQVYQRAPVRSNEHDKAAVTIMAYGLRTAVRNLAAEQASIKSFKAIYRRVPATASHWDIVRAIAYSGATR